MAAWALRVVALGFVAAAAVAGAAVSAARQPGPAAPRVRHVAVPHEVGHERRCASPIDRTLAHLVAPVTTVHLSRPLRVTPSLGQSGYVFPVLGPYPPFFDTFGAPRADVSWHHGDDLFAPRGTPVLAVANGVVFSVGWNRIGGWRLWLLDRSGNEFYYAHLERYTPLAVDGRRVEAGQTLGYVGATGDAQGTPPHLFFEINPASLRHLGYDGTVDPTRYLRHWQQLRAPRPAPPADAGRSLTRSPGASAACRR